MNPRRNFAVAIIGGVATFAMILVLARVVQGGQAHDREVAAQKDSSAAWATSR